MSEDDDLAFAGKRRHNHVTRDIKPVGQCPGCDEFWEGTYTPTLPARATQHREETTK